VIQDDPWWQTTKTARAGFMLGTFWTTLGLIGLLLFGAHAWSLIMSALFLAGGVTYLVTAVAMRRRERSRPGTRSQDHLTLPFPADGWRFIPESLLLSVCAHEWRARPPPQAAGAGTAPVSCASE
jgi:hypothetical protein